MSEAIDYSAINWVRLELGASLKRARKSLAGHAQQSGEPQDLRTCREELHQAGGSLQMVGLQDASQLVSEMETLVEALEEGRTPQPGVVLERLLQAFYRLPGYLERIATGYHDAARELVPLINGLRALRDAVPLPAASRFEPDLTLPVPACAYAPHTVDSSVEVRELARTKRGRFQAGLLTWYRSGELSGLQQMHGVLAELQRASRVQAAARLWWLGAGLAEAMLDSGLNPPIEVKRLFGRIDQQLRQLIETGEKDFATAIPPSLPKELLLQIPATGGSGTGRVREIRETYDLQCCAPCATSDDFSACNGELLGEVVAVALEELAGLGDRLDSLVAEAGHGPEGLDGLAEALHALANSTGMAGLGPVSRSLAECAERLRKMGNGELSLTESAMQEIASAVIAVEDTLKTAYAVASGPNPAGVSTDASYLEGLKSASREIVTDMVLCRNTIDDYLNSPHTHGQLDAVPGLLNRVRGGLQMIGQERAALLVAQISEYIEHILMGGEELPEEWRLDALAEAFCSVEYHIAELGENRDHGERVLDIAEQSLHRLGRCDPEARQDTAGGAQPASPGAGMPVISAVPVLVDDTDREILDVFIEEAAGELQRLKEQVPVWVAEPGDRDALETVRRSFHTLKGGARMTGALALGEFAAVFERLLNQVGSGIIEPDETVRACVTRSLEPLAQLFARLGGGPEPALDVDAIVAQAVRLAAADAAPVVAPAQTTSGVGELPGGVAYRRAAESTPLTAGTQAPDETPGAELVTGLTVLKEDADPEVIEVFLEEAAEVLAEIVEQLQVWTREPDNNDALVALRRCFHTLKGSGRIAGAMLAGEFCWTFENLLNRVIDGTVPASDGLFALLLRVPDAVAELVNQVSGGPAPDSDYQALMETAASLARGVVQNPAGAGDGEVMPALSSGTEAIAGADPVAGDEPGLLEIFARECQGHLELIREFVANCDRTSAACLVTEDLYRALHTLSGISESARVAPVQALASGLYAYIAELKERRQPVHTRLLDVLRDSARVIDGIIQHLPDMPFNADGQVLLQERIAALPPVPASVEEVPRPMADACLPAPEQAAVHAAPGAAAAAGAVSVVEKRPAILPDASGETVTDSCAELDPELLEIFLEEAGEIIEHSETILHTWTGQPASGELLKEFQRHLHTLKGGARMAGIQAIGNLGHSLETLVTRIADGQVTVTPELFELLHAAHDRLADMLEQVKVHRLPVTADGLEQVLDRCGMEPEAGTAGLSAAVEQRASEWPAIPASVAGTGTTPAVTQPELAPHAAPGDTAGDGASIIPPGLAAGPEPQTTGRIAETTQESQPRVDGSDGAAQPEPSRKIEPRPPQPYEARQEGARPVQVERRKSNRERGEQVRVQAELLDGLVNYAGEISIYRSRLEQQAGVYRFTLAEFDQTILRLREQLRQFEILTETQILYRRGQQTEDHNPDFDPLEMDRYSNLQQQSRLLLESINDLTSIQQMLVATTRDFETLLLQQSRVSTDLQEGLMHTRMIPFAGLAPRLRRIVRQAAQELDKQVELRIEGAEGEMDRTVIERIVAPLEHMLRNAVDHGIESSAQRQAAGKPESGTITISFRREGPEIVLYIADDGRGLDGAAIRERARERDLIGAGEELDDNDVMQFILQAGFSTASEVTQISGRGVGMDVVVSEVKQLGGSLHIDSTPGRGSIFTIRLPYTLAINQALLVRVCNDTYCIPLGNIEGVIRVAAEELNGCLQSSEALYEYTGNRYRLQHLGTLLNRGPMEPESMAGRVPVLLVRIGEQRVALIVEALLGHREIVVKPLGAQLSHVDGVSGATILGDGRVVLILDLAGVVRMGSRSRRIAGAQPRSGAGTSTRLQVMVVDDSITVRKVTARLLQKYGFDVVTARDGVDAMALLQDTVPDMMLLDVEMPRMDGFELATLMRNDERLRQIPIIMITSRTGDKHRERAGQIGVDRYLGKPYQEHELLATIHRLTGLPDSGLQAAQT
jgi:chemosensory pili system protein ChpA (sensor histidine kinase/response regulator)